MAGNHTEPVSERNENDVYDAVDAMWLSNIDKIGLTASSMKHITLSGAEPGTTNVRSSIRKSCRLCPLLKIFIYHCGIRGVWDSDKFSTVALDIMSLGKLMRANWSFCVESADSLVAVTTDKQPRFKVALGDDDILRLPHDMRSGRQSAPLPEILRQKAHVLSAKCAPEALNALLLHVIFLHRDMEKVYKTLMHTHGYVAQRLLDPF